MTTDPLSREARIMILAHGLTIAEYVLRHFPDGRWQGDRCGCPDDRCTGHHHDANDRCSCIEVLAVEALEADA
ncbi:hypothetical protein ACTXJ9_03175 [Brachybacterium tyrofermentans]|uniref:hypothetical protein n=1 Tax=Brachybacterium tyrofermentans TaxID=47848 RepID=UPI003FD25098